MPDAEVHAYNHPNLRCLAVSALVLFGWKSQEPSANRLLSKETYYITTPNGSSMVDVGHKPYDPFLFLETGSRTML